VAKSVARKKTLGHPVILYENGQPREKTFIYGRLSKAAKAGQPGEVEGRIYGRLRLVRTPEGHEFRIQGPMLRTTSDFDEEDLWGPILARVMLGREMYEDIDVKATTRDMEHARSILKAIAHALLSGERETLDSLPLVDDIVNARPRNETERLVAYRQAFDRLAEHHAILFGAGRLPPADWARHTVDFLAAHHDAAFGALAADLLAKAFSGISPKLGPEQTGPLRAAAEIAVHVGAFGTKRTDDFVAEVERMMSRMRKATNDAKRGAAAKKALRLR